MNHALEEFQLLQNRKQSARRSLLALPPEGRDPQVDTPPMPSDPPVRVEQGGSTRRPGSDLSLAR